MTRLAIVGASVRAAAQSAQRAGFDVVGADLFADADLDGVCPITKIEDYPEGLTGWLAEQDVDAWMYTGAMENYPDLVDRMARIAPLWGVSGEALRRCRDPLVLQDVCRDEGLQFPETRRLGDVGLHEEGWLGKTYRHSGGLGVWSLATEADRGRHPDAYAQRFVKGKSIAALYVVSPSRSILLGVTEQLMGDDPSDLGYVGSLGPVTCEGEAAKTIDRLGDCLHRGLGLTGLVGVDLIAEDDRLTVLEINPRFTASVEVLERVCDRSAVAALNDAYSGERFDAWPAPTGRWVIKWVLFARRAVTITPSFAEWSLKELRSGRFGDRPRAGESFAVGRPVATLFVEGDSAQAAEEALERATRETLARLYA